MIKMIFTSLVLVAFVACGKKNDDSPRAPINPQKDTQQVKDSKEAAQGGTKKADDPAKTGDGDQGAQANSNGDKTPSTSAPAPTAPETKDQGGSNASTPAPAPAAPTPAAPTPTPTPDTTPAPAAPPVTADLGKDKNENSQKGAQPAPEAPANKDESAKVDPKADETGKAPENANDQKDAANKDTTPEKKAETPPAGNAPQAQGEEPFKLGQGYDGTNLNLVANPKNYGEVLLKDEDAKRFYQALRVKENATGASKEWLAGQKKIGTHITCYTQESRTQKGVFANRCVLAMNFVKGELIQAPSQLAPDFTVKEIRESYQSKNLRLVYPDNHRTAFVSITGMDAKALYSVLNVPAKVNTTTAADFQASEFKAARNIYCIRHIPKANPNNPLYGCAMQLDYATGLARVVKK